MTTWLPPERPIPSRAPEAALKPLSRPGWPLAQGRTWPLSLSTEVTAGTRAPGGSTRWTQSHTGGLCAKSRATWRRASDVCRG